MDPVGEGSKLINIHLTICNNMKSTVEAFGVCYVVFQLCMGAVGMHFILKSITVMCNVNAAICFTQTDFLVMDNLYFCLNTVKGFSEHRGHTSCLVFIQPLSTY